MRFINKYKLVSLFMLVFVFMSCDALLEENKIGGKFNDEVLWGNPILAEGVLLKAYSMVPGDYNLNDTYASDDAVTNVTSSQLVSMATGGYTSRLNPLNVYSTTYEAFMHLNSFLENVDKVQWAWRDDLPGEDNASVRNKLFIRKFKGEAFALRAWYGARLLRHHGGIGTNNVLLGYPIVTRVIRDAEEGKLPRNTYAECVQQIFNDCDSAVKYLPLKWSDVGLTASEKEIIGAKNVNRISGIGAMAIKSRVALLAASPAFKDGSGVTMQQAAQIAANVMKAHIGITDLNAADVEFYKSGYVTAPNLSTFREALWYSSINNNASSREANFFPPSIFGRGQVNPSQNLVEAFGFNNGHFYDESSTSFNPLDPYANRDPRLSKYIVLHNSKVGPNTIDITAGENASGPTATRTGYFMRKLLDETVSVNPSAPLGKPHSILHLRYTEVLLNFAEAANEAGGPDVAFEGFTAREVIRALRVRAGFNPTLNNVYINALNKSDLEKVIRNERRIELCFEGFRFWDIRRWNDTATMTKPVIGINPVTLSKFEVEPRVYSPHMIYPPIPYNETLIYNIIQNKGWE
jgi:hypothetical protein